MHSKSYSIKSKKDKLKDKKQERYSQKQRSLKKHMQIIDQSSSQSCVQIKKVPDKNKNRQSQKKNNIIDFDYQQGAALYNRFDYQKFRKVRGPIKSSYKPPILQVQQCFTGILQDKPNDNRTISYRKVGGNSQKTVCQNYLKTRLQNNKEQTKIIDKPIIEIQQKNDIQLKQSQDKIQIIKFRRPPRYFDDQIQVESNQGSQVQDDDINPKKNFKCFRCGQKGHIARLCNQSQILKCMYCLGPHHHTDCTDQLCHRCNEKGHLKQQCKSDRIQCRKCRYYGHIAKNCGKIMMMNFSSQRQKQIRQNYDRDDLQRLKCFKCNGYRECKGHFNCHKYNKKTPRIYDQPYLIQ